MIQDLIQQIETPGQRLKWFYSVWKNVRRCFHGEMVLVVTTDYYHLFKEDLELMKMYPESPALTINLEVLNIVYRERGVKALESVLGCEVLIRCGLIEDFFFAPRQVHEAFWTPYEMHCVSIASNCLLTRNAEWN